MAKPLDTRNALVALNRFGLGAKPGDLSVAAPDPRGFLKEEISQKDVALLSGDLPSSSKALQMMFADQARKREERARMAAAETPTAGVAAGGTMVSETAAASPEAKPPQEPNLEQKLFRAEAMARFKKQCEAKAGFVERLVAFWSNHFAVSAAKGPFLRVAAGPFEREAIRPSVLGRYEDMLRAVESHPAMLHYLDNQQSIGPNSPAGRNRGRGLNENLAREILELHTLGVNAGYAQDDVKSLAKILTGWTTAGPEGRMGEPGTFVFVPNWHEPGAQVLLSRDYAQQGVAQGESALSDLARHPATATHIATKLARHFISDDPPPAVTEKLAGVFRETDGDLRAVSLCLIDDDSAWQLPLAKIRTPAEFLIAISRATGYFPSGPGPLIGALNTLGMPLWQPPGPNGFADTEVWASPEGMKLRLDLAMQIAQRIRDAGHPLSVLDTIAGLVASPETREAVSHAESRPQALAILFMSPKFLRR
ncbi:MAG TPA: DUF1800 family protein [Methylocella sp.]|nr:DUF1800 family protein [Methylocella sp.]